MKATFDPKNAYHMLFWQEAQEQLANIESDLLALEILFTPLKASEQDLLERKATVEQLFRNAHSLKGASATMGLVAMTEITHDMETIFDQGRKQEFNFKESDFNHLFSSLDQLQKIHKDLMHETALASAVTTNPTLGDSDVPSRSQSNHQTHEAHKIRFAFVKDASLLSILAYQIIQTLAPQYEIVETIPPRAIEVEDDDLFKGQLDVKFKEQVNLDDVRQRLKFMASIADISSQDDPPQLAISKIPKPQKNKTLSYMKMPLEILDKWVSLTTELALNHANVLSTSKRLFKLNPKQIELVDLLDRLENMEQFVTDLQQMALDSRMLTLDTLYLPIPRLVRNISQELGKPVHLDLQGGHLKLDKVLLEALHDPIHHIVRNALDHGLESQSERLKKGKDPLGSLTISAIINDNQLIIQLSDDGGGIDVENIRKKAQARGLLDASMAQELSKKDTLNLLFESGFSTKDEVSHLSGRGVGLDVVKKNLNQISASLEIHTEIDLGTTFVIKMPLSLAVIKSLIVKRTQYLLALPIHNVQAIFRVRSRDLSTRISKDHSGFLCLWHDAFIPLYCPIDNKSISPSDLDNDFYVCVISTSMGIFALFIDSLLYEEQIVMVPILGYKGDGGVISADSHLTGSAVLGDGSICFCIDLMRFSE